MEGVVDAFAFVEGVIGASTLVEGMLSASTLVIDLDLHVCSPLILLLV